jgi:hypothetical protein
MVTNTTTIVEYKGWGLDEKMKYIHLNCGKIDYVTICTGCGSAFPHEQWRHLRRIRALLLPKNESTTGFT